VGNGALVEGAQAGDRAALAEIYSEYGDRLYDFCFRIVRDRNAAADAVQDTFVLVVQRVQQLRDPERLQPWLYAIARHVSFRYRQNFQREAVLYSVVVRDATDAATPASEAPLRAASLVEDAAEGMSDRDRLVLDLHERHGLDGDDLTAALGVQHANPYSLVHRAREQLERAVGVLLVTRLGRSDCAQLDELLGDWDGSLTPLLRKRVGRHIDHCATCTALKSKTDPLALLTAVPMLLLPQRADAAGLDFITLISARFGLSDERWPDDGFPPPMAGADERDRRRAPVLLWLGGVACIAVGLVTIISAVGAGDGDSSVDVGAPTTTASSTATTRALVDATTVAPPPTDVVTTVAGITESIPPTPTTRRRPRTTATTRPGSTPTTGASAPAGTTTPGTTTPGPTGGGTVPSPASPTTHSPTSPPTTSPTSQEPTPTTAGTTTSVTDSAPTDPSTETSTGDG
jgi:RNA polymerase sigma factor (sigma-70 family)